MQFSIKNLTQTPFSERTFSEHAFSEFFSPNFFFSEKFFSEKSSPKKVLRKKFSENDFSEKLDHKKIQKSIDSQFDEILVKLNYSLLNLNLLKSTEQSITPAELSYAIQLANNYRNHIRLKSHYAEEEMKE